MFKNLTAVVCFWFVASAACAQMGMMRPPSMPRGIFKPVVGSGAVYNIQSSDGKNTSMEIDVVGKESVDGKDGYWFETVITGEQTSPMGNMVIKTLTVLDGADSYPSKVVMQMGDRPPMEMPAQMTQRMQQKQTADIRGSADDVGSESVTVPAGTFTCEHYRMKDGSGDAWISQNISPYGVVKYQGKDSTMQLAKVVTDAKDKITGTPQPFNPQAMMGQRPPQ